LKKCSIENDAGRPCKIKGTGVWSLKEKPSASRYIVDENETDIKRAAGRKYRNPEFDRSGEVSLRKVMEKSIYT
jgi:hypothetical protein